MFKGSIPALITPFRDGQIDWRAFEALIEDQIAQGSHGIVVCGTTGESPTLTYDEHKSIVERAVALVKKRIPVIAGTGSNSTAKTIEATAHAKKAGADAALIVTPYYNKPTQDGLYAHYKAVAQAVDMPIIIYNIPGRSVIDMKTETMARIAKDCRNIIGVKDATGDVSRVAEIRAQVGAEFMQLSGEDANVYDYIAAGGHGAISVTANAAPALCAAVQNLWKAGKKADSQAMQERLMPMHKALFVETSPAPIKYAMARLGFCTAEVRLPLVPASETARRAVDAAMEKAGLLDQPARKHG